MIHKLARRVLAAPPLYPFLGLVGAIFALQLTCRALGFL